MTSSGLFSYDRTVSTKMEKRSDMALVFERVVTPANGRAAPPRKDESEHSLDVAVVFTTAAATVAALRMADALASQLGACIRMLVPQVVPYPLPLQSPPILLDFSEQRFREIALESGVGTTVQIYLCRDKLETLQSVLAPRSVVVIGGQRRWWPTREARLARKLRRAGQEVIFAEME
jgi:hypothetical protein